MDVLIGEKFEKNSKQDKEFKEFLKRAKTSFKEAKKGIWKEVRETKEFNEFPMQLYYYPANNFKEYYENKDEFKGPSISIRVSEKITKPKRITKSIEVHNEKELRDIINHLEVTDSSEFVQFVLILACNDLNFKYNSVWDWLI